MMILAPPLVAVYDDDDDPPSSLPYYHDDDEDDSSGIGILVVDADTGGHALATQGTEDVNDQSVSESADEPLEPRWLLPPDAGTHYGGPTRLVCTDIFQEYIGSGTLAREVIRYIRHNMNVCRLMEHSGLEASVPVGLPIHDGIYRVLNTVFATKSLAYEDSIDLSAGTHNASDGSIPSASSRLSAWTPLPQLWTNMKSFLCPIHLNHLSSLHLALTHTPFIVTHRVCLTAFSRSQDWR